MTTPEIPNYPPANYLYGHSDNNGNFVARPIRHEADQAGNSVPYAQKDDGAMQEVAEACEDIRTSWHIQLLDELAHVPRIDPSVTHEDRIDHFLHALGLPTAPLVAVKNLNEVPSTGMSRDIAEYFRKDPTRAGGYFALYRLLVTAPGRGRFSPEELAVHEKVHSTGMDTVTLLPEENDMWSLSRVGLMLFRPANAPQEDRHISGSLAEEGGAEWLTAAYADLFLPRPAPMAVRSLARRSLVVPGKYIYGAQSGEEISTAASTGAAIAIELLGERNPEIFESLISARLSIDGLRSFAKAVENCQPGLYRTLMSTPNKAAAHRKAMRGIVASLYGGDFDVMANLGSKTRAFIVPKLQAYEARTGYSFGLPPDVYNENQPNLPTEETTAATRSSDFPGETGRQDDISSYLKRLREGFNPPSQS